MLAPVIVTQKTAARSRAISGMPQMREVTTRSSLSSNV